MRTFRLSDTLGLINAGVVLSLGFLAIVSTEANTPEPSIPTRLQSEELIRAYQERLIAYRTTSDEDFPANNDGVLASKYPENGFYTGSGTVAAIDSQLGDIFKDIITETQKTTSSSPFNNYVEDSGQLPIESVADDLSDAKLNRRWRFLTTTQISALTTAEAYEIAKERVSASGSVITMNATRRGYLGQALNVYASTPEQAVQDALAQAFAELNTHTRTQWNPSWYSGQFHSGKPYKARADVTRLLIRFNSAGSGEGLSGQLLALVRAQYGSPSSVTHPIPADGKFHANPGTYSIVFEGNPTSGTMQGAYGGLTNGVKYLFRPNFQYGLELGDDSEEEPKDPDCADGNVSSVHFSFPLGSSRFGKEAGSIKLSYEKPDPDWYSPRGLNVRGQYGFSSVKDYNTQKVVQIIGPGLLVHVNEISNSKYELQYFHWDGSGVPDSNGVYPVPSGSPHTVYTVENPDTTGGTYNQLRIKRAHGTQEDAWLFSYDGATEVWTYTKDNGQTLVDYSEPPSGDPAVRIELRTTKDLNGVVLSKIEEHFETFAWGEEKIKETVDPDGAALTTTWEFYEDAVLDGDNYGFQKSMVDENGYWEVYSYDAFGRLIKVKSSFKNAAFNAADNLCRVVEYEYPTPAGGGTAVDYYTTIEKLLGQEIGRSYRRVTIEGYDEYTCTTAGAAITDPGNLLYQYRIHLGNAYAGEVKSIRHQDGTFETYEYTALDDQGNVDFENGISLTTVVSKGEPDSGLTSVVDGVRETTVVDRRGNVLAETVVDIASGLTIEQRLTTSQDSFGRPLSVSLQDGRTEAFDYDCCGLTSKTDSLGITTSMQNQDNVVRSETRLGITEVIKRDGRDSVTERVSQGGTVIEVSRKTYDIAGRLISEARPGGRTLTIAYSADSSGNQVHTTTLPNGALQIDTYYPDGSLVSRTGNGVFPESWDYGVGVGGYFEENVKLDATGNPTTESVKVFHDLAKRPVSSVRSDGATITTEYNALNQVIKRVDADGVTSLFSYDGQGRLEVSAVDMDNDDAITIAGSDLVTRTDVSVVMGAGGFPVVRKTQEVFQADGVATATEISRVDTEVTGNGRWHVSNAGTTSRVLAHGGNGNWTATSQLIDGGTVLEEYSGGRLSRTVHSNGAGVVFQETSYQYDEFGRVSHSTDARAGTTVFTYYDTDEVHVHSSPAPGDGRPAETTVFQYDLLGNQDLVTLPDGGTVDYDYFPNGLLQTVTGTRTYPQSYAYSDQGRLTSLTTNVGTAEAQVTTWGYDAVSGLNVSKTVAGGTSTLVSYTSAGRISTRTNGRGTVITHLYDAAGRLSSIDYSDATPDVAYTYHRNGDMHTVSRAGSVRTFAYGDPGIRELETVVGGLHDGLTIDPSYDGLNRRTSVSYTLGSQGLTQSRSYQVGSSRVETVSQGTVDALYAYHANSSLVQTRTSRENGAVRVTQGQTYNNFGQVTSVGALGTGTNNPMNKSFTFTRNTADQIVQLDYENGEHTAYSYDALGHLSSASRVLANGDPLAGQQFEYDYDLLGNRTAGRFGGDSSGGGLSSRTYTPAGGDRNQYASIGNPGIAYTTGKANTGASVLVNGVAPAERQGEYFSDSATVVNTSTAALASFAISATENGVTDSYTAEKLVPIATETFSYDLDGNLTSDGFFSYTWDAENRLTSVETISGQAPAGVSEIRVEYEYDYLSRRIGRKAYKKVLGSWALQEDQVFVFEESNIVGEWDGAGALVKSFLWGVDLQGADEASGGAGGLVALTIHTGSNSGTHFASNDGSGNVIGLTNAANGEVSAIYEYDPFGNLLASTGDIALENPFRFSSQWMDDYTGQLLYLHRVYDPVHGRWLSRDPLAEDGGLNLYAFLRNDPVGDVDLLGLQSARRSRSGPYMPASYPGYVQVTALEAGLNGLVEGVVLYAEAVSEIIVSTGEFIGNDVALLVHNREEYARVWQARAQLVEEFAEIARQMLIDPCYREKVLEILGQKIADQLSTPEGWSELLRYLSIGMVADAATGGRGTAGNLLKGLNKVKQLLPDRGLKKGGVAVAPGTGGGGWLQHWEGIGRGRSVGHTLERHVGQADADLLARLSSNPRLRNASTFTDQATAEAVIGRTISANRNQLNAWILGASPGDRLRLNYSGTDVIGRGATRGVGVGNRTNARAILQMRDNGKYHILTAFPE